MVVVRSRRNTGRRGSGQAFLREAVRPVVETLENRQFFAATVGSGANALATTLDAALTQPSVRSVTPAAGATNVPRDAFVAADVNLPNAGIDPATLSAATVKLYRTGDHSLVPAVVNTTGGGDAIVLPPPALLDANTSYTFEVTDGVKDTGGTAFVPFTMTFTTGTATTPADPRHRVREGPAHRRHRPPVHRPDHRPRRQALRRARIDGLILRFTINADGTLGAPEVISTVQTTNGGTRLRHRHRVRPGVHRDQPDPVGQPQLATRSRTRPTGPARSAGSAAPNLEHVPGLRRRPAAQRPRPPDQPARRSAPTARSTSPRAATPPWAPRTTRGACAPSTCSAARSCGSTPPPSRTHRQRHGRST